MNLIDPKTAVHARQIPKYNRFQETAHRFHTDIINILLYRLYFDGCIFITIDLIFYYIDQFPIDILIVTISPIGRILYLIIPEDKGRAGDPFRTTARLAETLLASPGESISDDTGDRTAIISVVI